VLRWQQLARRSDEDLARCDIAATNLCCAEGLPDARSIDPSHCFFQLDYWSRRVAQATTRLLPQFRRKRSDDFNSEAYFRVLCMVTVLQRDLGVRYNPAKIDPIVPLDTADTFIQGITQGDGGTCASLPVVYAAVGRRLGYPLKLVEAKAGNLGHLFARWEEGKERFNIEATHKGLTSNPDDYYRTGVYALTPQQEREGCLLQSLTPRQELAVFLCQRAFRWLDFGDYWPAVEPFAWACALYPGNVSMKRRLAGTIRAWDEVLAKAVPRGFPPLTVLNWPPRRFPQTLAEETERQILRLQAVEAILCHPDHRRDWWEPLRRGQCVLRRPVAAAVVFGESDFEVRFRHSA
jgi:hypothetical protein